jgi:hypothetical protein
MSTPRPAPMPNDDPFEAWRETDERDAKLAAEYRARFGRDIDDDPTIDEELALDERIFDPNETFPELEDVDVDAEAEVEDDDADEDEDADDDPDNLPFDWT